MVHLAVSQKGTRPKFLEVKLEVDFYATDQVAESACFIEQLNKELVEFLRTIPNSEDRDGNVRAYVTLCTQSYLFGLIGLCRSLRKHSSVPLICLIDSDFEFDDLIDFDNVYFVRVPRLINAQYQPWRKEFSNVMSKLWVFGLTAFDKIVFLDSDVCVVSSVDELFDFATPSFAPDYVDHLHTQRFNSGVFVISPKATEFRSLLDFSNSAHSYDGGDQGILNHFFSGRHRWLPRKYNVLRHQAYYGNKISLKEQGISIIHYIVKKPWEIKYREPCDAFLVELEDQWTDNLTKDDLLRLIRHWRKEIFILYERDKIASARDVRRILRTKKTHTRMLMLLLFLTTLTLIWTLVR